MNNEIVCEKVKKLLWHNKPREYAQALDAAEEDFVMRYIESHDDTQVAETYLALRTLRKQFFECEEFFE